MTTEVVLWALPLLLVSRWPHPLAAFLAVALLGLGNPLVDVNVDTSSSGSLLTRCWTVFGALESCLISTMALGAVLMPILVSWLGPAHRGLAVVGLGVTVVALVGLPRMRSLDVRLSCPEGIDVLQSIPMFAPLAPSVLETLARRLTPVRVPSGEVFIREGETSDRFYVIASGLAEVTHGSTVLRREGVLRGDRPAPRRAAHGNDHRGRRHRAAGPRAR